MSGLGSMFRRELLVLVLSSVALACGDDDGAGDDDARDGTTAQDAGGRDAGFDGGAAGVTLAAATPGLTGPRTQWSASMRSHD